MELLFLAILIILMGIALASGFPVAFALPGSAILSIMLASLTGLILEGNVDAYFILVELWSGFQQVLQILGVFIGKLKETH